MFTNSYLFPVDPSQLSTYRIVAANSYCITLYNEKEGSLVLCKFPKSLVKLYLLSENVHLVIKTRVGLLIQWLGAWA